MENHAFHAAGSYPYADCGNAPVSCMDERFDYRTVRLCRKVPRYKDVKDGFVLRKCAEAFGV
ncbi:hypothetical protein [Paenibacillus azoreducens]|uniref:Uncharacterized protein n=1 Tax=Paenibacillus azoreducens TaxID=116718 RepID=A0A919YHC3_9BACL|nr:hypothetical protein [Paenibacillus azoreducens]GIO50641.1 hypothetical protein J34TS1_54060 [Paenibacillus azoreducens]